MRGRRRARRGRRQRLLLAAAVTAVAAVASGGVGALVALSPANSTGRGAHPGSAATPLFTSGSSTAPGTLASGPSSSSPPASASSTPAGCAPWDCRQVERFAAAEALIRGKPGSLGIVVRDRASGAVWRAGTPGHLMWTSSTIKLAIAVSVLERGRAGEVTVDATARSQIAAMLATSDNDAADALWNRYGKDRMVTRFQQVYGMSGLTFVDGFSRYWGFMKCTAEDLQRLMTYVLERLDSGDRATIMGGMRGVAPIQQWGVWAAGSALQPGTKDGWSIESDGATPKHWCTSTVGFVGPDARYAVAVMYDEPVGSTIDAGVHAISDLVATVFGAKVPAAVTVPDPSTGL